MFDVLASPALIFLTGLAVAADEAAPELALRGLDPIELAAGREVTGDESLTADHILFRYRFATAANRDRFLADPEEHAIQFDGACGRMGPLSGAGAPDRFAVHEGRIFVFASEACRSTFLKSPDDYLTRPDAEPEGDPASRQRGRELIERAVEGVGGVEALDGVESVRYTYALSSEGSDRWYHGTRTVTLGLPGSRREDEFWDNGSDWTYLLTPEGAFQRFREQRSRCGERVREHVRRDALRHPLFLLASRAEIGFEAIAAGPAKAGETAVELVHVSHDGCTATLSIDPANGRILELASTGQGPYGYTRVVTRFSEFQDAGGGLILPRESLRVIDGTPRPRRGESLLSIEVDRELPADFFAPQD